jgi:hypothetical protein
VHAKAGMVCIVENIFRDGEWTNLEWRDSKLSFLKLLRNPRRAFENAAKRGDKSFPIETVYFPERHYA